MGELKNMVCFLGVELDCFKNEQLCARGYLNQKVGGFESSVIQGMVFVECLSSRATAWHGVACV